MEFFKTRLTKTVGASVLVSLIVLLFRKSNFGLDTPEAVGVMTFLAAFLCFAYQVYDLWAYRMMIMDDGVYLVTNITVGIIYIIVAIISNFILSQEIWTWVFRPLDLFYACGIVPYRIVSILISSGIFIAEIVVVGYFAGRKENMIMEEIVAETAEQEANGELDEIEEPGYGDPLE